MGLDSVSIVQIWAELYLQATVAYRVAQFFPFSRRICLFCYNFIFKKKICLKSLY